MKYNNRNCRKTQQMMFDMDKDALFKFDQNEIV